MQGQQQLPYQGGGGGGTTGQGGVFPGYTPNQNQYPPQGHPYNPQQQQIQQSQYNFSPPQQQQPPPQQMHYNPQGYAPQQYGSQQQQQQPVYGMQHQQQQQPNMMPQQHQQQQPHMMVTTQQPVQQQSYVHSSPSTGAYSLPSMAVYNNTPGISQPTAPYYPNGLVQNQQQQSYESSTMPPQPISVPVPSPRTAAAAPLRTATATGRPLRPPYTDPVTQIVYTVDNPEYEGFLTKQSTWLKEWRRRYFILQGSKLFFCKNAVSGPHGMMDLATCTTVKSADLKSGKRHSFEISTAETCYLLYADTESEKDDWIGRVGKAIVRCSRTYYKGEGNASSGGGNGANGANVNYANQYNAENDDDDIYENDDPDNPYFND